MKNLSIFEPQIEKHHAYKKKTCIMIPYLHEKMQEIRWSRFLENRLTN